ncbi:glycerol kinase, partial [Sesbania bispinosa]
GSCYERLPLSLKPSQHRILQRPAALFGRGKRHRDTARSSYSGGTNSSRLTPPSELSESEPVLVEAERHRHGIHLRKIDD